MRIKVRLHTTRVIFIRSLALVYLVAFLVAYNRDPGLIGDMGCYRPKNTLVFQNTLVPTKHLCKCYGNSDVVVVL